MARPPGSLRSYVGFRLKGIRRELSNREQKVRVTLKGFNAYELTSVRLSSDFGKNPVKANGVRIL